MVVCVRADYCASPPCEGLPTADTFSSLHALFSISIIPPYVCLLFKANTLHADKPEASSPTTLTRCKTQCAGCNTVTPTQHWPPQGHGLQAGIGNADSMGAFIGWTYMVCIGLLHSHFHPCQGSSAVVPLFCCLLLSHAFALCYVPTLVPAEGDLKACLQRSGSCAQLRTIAAWFPAAPPGVQLMTRAKESCMGQPPTPCSYHTYLSPASTATPTQALSLPPRMLEPSPRHHTYLTTIPAITPILALFLPPRMLEASPSRLTYPTPVPAASPTHAPLQPPHLLKLNPRLHICLRPVPAATSV